MPEHTHRHGDPPTGGRAEPRPRYRSLRDLSRTARPTREGRRGPEPPRIPPPGDEAAFSEREDAQPGQETETAPASRSGLRQALFGAVAMLLLVGVVWGGYRAYHYLAPYYGRGYVTGGTGAVQDVRFTITKARCALQSVPDSTATPTRGQFCVVEIRTVNRSDRNRYLSLTTFSVQLDTGLRTGPASTAMNVLSVKLRPGESKEFRLVYDVWDGTRMNDLKVQIGYETTNIPLR